MIRPSLRKMFRMSGVLRSVPVHGSTGAAFSRAVAAGRSSASGAPASATGSASSAASASCPVIADTVQGTGRAPEHHRDCALTVRVIGDEGALGPVIHAERTVRAPGQGGTAFRELGHSPGQSQQHDYRKSSSQGPSSLLLSLRFICDNTSQERCSSSAKARPSRTCRFLKEARLPFKPVSTLYF